MEFDVCDCPTCQAARLDVYDPSVILNFEAWLSISDLEFAIVLGQLSTLSPASVFALEALLAMIEEDLSLTDEIIQERLSNISKEVS